MLILLFLILIVVAVSWFTKKFEHNPLLRHLPAPLWCYFLPMLASWAGIIPHEHALYPALSKHLLPACLILLLAGAHLKHIWHLGPAALLSMLAGTLAIILGGPLLFALFHRWMPEDAWLGLGALSASWTGGSANMIAVKEVTQVPDSLFSIMIIVDSVIAYLWMGFVITLSSFQKGYDRWNHSKTQWLRKVKPIELDPKELIQSKLKVGQVLMAMALAFSIGELALIALPNVPSGAVLLATLAGIFLSFIKSSRFHKKTFEKTGYFLLFLLLTSIGARANLNGIVEAPVYLLFGLAWVLVMALVLFVVGRIFRIPLFFLATASQANVGGTASATLVAAVYQPHLAFVGLLLAILGNVFGTYLGIGATHLMKWVM